MEQRAEINGIPCLVMGNGAPRCIMYHGWGSRKEVLQFFGSILAQNGFTVYIPDAPHHGERGSFDYHSAEGKERFWDVILEMVEEYPQLAAGLPGSGPLFLVGSSMGGFAGSAMFARHRDVAGIVNLMGACAWEKAEEVFRRMSGRPAAEDEELARIREYDPLPLLKEQNRPMLLLHGSSDPVVPVEIQRFAYKELGQPEAVTFTEIPRIGHTTTLWMAEETVRWLKGHV
ncbi:alpha/beta fold hydrolase [Ectobacillus ponti]|uniref:Alpha/beta fold hydrolase n=1 Tax=Ectobacillus ponti TaxID=2961894 RepID=A0AA42BSM8_9BACI|nr:alpha/beta fold hydrolase [Ectobacillus ponti]MCP8968608.1 alpha/beta fold hydrolase [Ectobacillus ponti]